ncbi:hypothetical protein DEU56DRAFT_801005 [Suillus clintonianus]|uniref:uncharacterized protein n=1 Tax=Suillus clintonianus TaxID=1904413 RepID=UPI001B86E7F6|nr:uncharacterized protein DEU56DRAFT_801005 [Suillus clintonianus]KAG2138947.1 hypothetical protein DEU56DRAFT_801005 [Suillus clintonianus]
MNMSRLTPPLSLLSNLSAVSASTTTEEENTVFVTEQFLPRKQDAVFGDQFVFQTSETNQHIRARLVMLSPFPCDARPFAKSVAFLSSRSGSIKAEVFRTPGAENHFFRLYIFACSAGVKIILPPSFRGTVSINDYESLRRKRQICCGRAFNKRMRRGFIKLGSSCGLENDDEVLIHAEGKIELRLRTEGDVNDRVWSRMDRGMRKIFQRRLGSSRSALGGGGGSS